MKISLISSGLAMLFQLKLEQQQKNAMVDTHSENMNPNS